MHSEEFHSPDRHGWRAEAGTEHFMPRKGVLFALSLPKTLNYPNPEIISTCSLRFHLLLIELRNLSRILLPHFVGLFLFLFIPRRPFFTTSCHRFALAIDTVGYISRQEASVKSSDLSLLYLVVHLYAAAASWYNSTVIIVFGGFPRLKLSWNKFK